MKTSEKRSALQDNSAISKINARSDKAMTTALVLYFLFGIGIAFFYDTYAIALGVGGICLFAYFLVKALLPNHSLYKYVLSVVFGVFAAQYIYQMHGMFEMHFIFFVGSALLIVYQEWKLQLPLLIFILLHHGTFAYLQYSGMKDIYFTQLDYMDIRTFLFHGAIAGVIIFINALWGFVIGKQTIETMYMESQLQQQVKNVAKNVSFAEEISRGNLEVQYETTKGDDLGDSLLRMKQNLVEATHRERTDKYITAGVATVGELLRKNSEDMKALSEKLIGELTKYTESNQGGIFLLEEEAGHSYLELKACYAYDRQKFMNKRVEIGESLVGQCFLEKQVIVMTQIPKDYVKITSGLGLATPSCIILVPLLANEEVTGVLEFASFTPYDEKKVEFLKKVAEAIATSILNVKTTERIKRLLNDSQMREEAMRAQEEEMRQNMEELSATQEEMNRSATEMESRVEAINNSGIASIEFHLDGTIVTANQSFLNLMGYSLEEIQGRHHRIFVTEEYAAEEEYKQFWENLANGITQPGEYERINKRKERVFINGSYSVIRDRNGNPQRVLKLATDITRIKLMEEKFSERMSA
jgi:methyl-accepting chemotaxis protein